MHYEGGGEEMKTQVSLYPETKSQVITEAQEKELLELCKKIKTLTGGTAACSDALDQLGFSRCSMNPNIGPFFPEKGRMCGLAYTIRGANITGLPPGTSEVRETVDVEYYDGIRPGYVLTYGTECAERGTVFGDVICTYANSKGAVGALSDGPVRDLERIKPLDLLPFGVSAAPVSGEGRVLWIEYNCIVQVGGVWVEPFDIIFGDMDGVVVIPKSLANRVYNLAKELCDKEDAMKEDFVNHKELSLLEVFAKNKRRA
jgi:regulator of RNase E activity RraA